MVFAKFLIFDTSSLYEIISQRKSKTFARLKSLSLRVFEATKSISKKIKNIPQHGRIRLIELGVAAAGAGDGGEFFVLDVEYFGESAAGGAKNAGFVVGVAAFRALVSLMLHESAPF